LNSQLAGVRNSLYAKNTKFDNNASADYNSYKNLTYGFQSMNTTKLSSKGQVIIPKPLRTSHRWEVGQELIVVDLGDGILLKPKAPFPVTDIDDVASCLAFKGKAKTLADMELAIAKGIQEKYK